MSRRDPQRVADYLGHILQAIDSIREYTSGATAGSYMADRKTQDAVVRNLEVIGEASNNIVKHHAEFAAAHPAVPWRFAYEMRNALSHGYFTIDHTLVWQTIQHDLPSLREQVVRLLET
ncbi:Uncharacterized conserved protein, contains HEPN domain [Variovorax sp. NFACC28]|nr:Uncharacterized conserved protein, contains HEPN domain [Variovorax sp. NFACC28]SEG28094.1 Uncharacterized conserved protein, contains HEPN domain [Variovorax sp. NFACC29]SFC44247.1 Uncharacterized conserved protein, contains HEPN domain [Variovorax sp. NFACC26]SFF91426.1 Uncharacterized conserved protein, contains HEPN domain [Variovorax sp. NFACC27]